MTVRVVRRCAGLVSAWLAAVACGGGERPRPTPDDIVTTMLATPPEGAAFEPSLVIDPANPDRLFVAASRGIAPIRRSVGIWTWASVDGGRTWSDRALAPPHFPGDSSEQVTGANAVARVAADGAVLVTSVAGFGWRTGTFVSRQTPTDGTASAVAAFENFIDTQHGRGIVFEAPWMTVDLTDGSPFHGAVYVAASAIVLDGAPSPPDGAAEPVPSSSVRLASSRDGGQSFAPLTLVADSAFGPRLAATSRGALHVTYVRRVTALGSARTIFHRRSTDGGATFGGADTVATMSADTLLDRPVLAARPNGDLLACWSQGVRQRAQTNQVRCAARRARGKWSAPHPVEPALPAEAAEAWPAIVGTERGWYLLQYVVGASRTEVVLYQSDDGLAFTRLVTLAAAEQLGVDRFCLTSVAPCRRTGGYAFVLGDYVTLAAGGGRLAGAFVLPRTTGGTSAAAAVQVSVVREVGGRGW